jgi:hypothetical protein
MKRVSNTIRGWLDNHFSPEEDIGILDRIEEFANVTLVNNGTHQLSALLLQLVTRRVSRAPFRQYCAYFANREPAKATLKDGSYLVVSYLHPLLSCPAHRTADRYASLISTLLNWHVNSPSSSLAYTNVSNPLNAYKSDGKTRRMTSSLRMSDNLYILLTY